MGEAENPLLALDYDGTLAPFKAERMAAKPLPGIVETLESIIRNTPTTVTIVSGRPIFELDRLAGPVLQKVITIGSHGWEWRDTTGRLRPAPLEKRIKALLEKAFHAALEEGKQTLGEEAEKRVEQKAASVALHVRGLTPETAERWLAAIHQRWDGLKAPGMEIMSFDGGLEIRSTERNKGRAIEEIINFVGNPDFVVYVGDDATDEDAFRALPENGAGVKVGHGPTAAHYRLADCESVRTFLQKWPGQTSP